MDASLVQRASRDRVNKPGYSANSTTTGSIRKTTGTRR
jgi:hypothetical protein